MTYSEEMDMHSTFITGRYGIVHHPDPVLRKQAFPVETFDRFLKDLAGEMLDIMKSNNGIGLAAPQIGVSLRVVTADIGAGPFVAVNPTILETFGLENGIEGCLSLPGMAVPVERGLRIDMKGLDITGRPLHVWQEGLMARVLQHELDHLEGVLICDYENPEMEKD